jgi:hypothetical protein
MGRPDPEKYLDGEEQRHSDRDGIGRSDIGKMRHDTASSALADDAFAISSERMRRSITAARVRAMVIAANSRVNPNAENSSGQSMLAAMVGAPVRPIDAGW